MSEKMKTGLFPYAYIGEQKKIVELIRETVAEGRSAVIESGTGTGKTVVSLTGSLESALGTGKKIVYLTRTKSQQKQIISEAREISKKEPVICIGLQGRSVHTCPMMAKDPENAGGTSEELSRLCSQYKKDDGTGSPCKFYKNIGDAETEEMLEFMRTEHPEPENFADLCLKREICPYEMTKQLIRFADVIACPYSFVFMTHVREKFLTWMGKPISDTIMIVDEAHNLPDYLRDTMTFEYSLRAMELAEKEAMERNDPDIHSGFSVTDIISVLKECLNEALAQYLIEDDGIIPSTFLQDEMMYRLGVSSHTLNLIYKGLMDQGEMVADIKRLNRKLPRSYILSLGRFLSAWNMLEDDINIFLVAGGDNPKFQAYCLDPYPAAEPLRECHASIHMSGTLAPLSDYSEELGLTDQTERTFPSPFPPDNLKIIYVDDVSTKYDEFNNVPEVYAKMKEHLISLIGCTDKNTAVFFPSYAVMERFLGDNISESTGKELFIERRGMSQPELMEEVLQFRISENSVLFAITGGRISEGLDFPDKDLEVAIIVGIPYPKPTAKQEALRRYYDMKFGDGWKHSSKIPAMRKMRQAIGRLIRSETDVGAAVILDRRVFSLEDIKSELTSDPCSATKDFFKSKGR